MEGAPRVQPNHVRKQLKSGANARVMGARKKPVLEKGAPIRVNRINCVEPMAVAPDALCVGNPPRVRIYVDDMGEEKNVISPSAPTGANNAVDVADIGDHRRRPRPTLYLNHH